MGGWGGWGRGSGREGMLKVVGKVVAGREGPQAQQWYRQKGTKPASWVRGKVGQV